MTPKKDYVCGFMFDTAKTHVAMMYKTTGPECTRFRYNGIGGKVEGNEHPRHTMVREFQEETGVVTKAEDWALKAELCGPDFIVRFYAAVSEQVYRIGTQPGKDAVACRAVRHLLTGERQLVPNLLWIIPLMLDGNITAPVRVLYD